MYGQIQRKRPRDNSGREQRVWTVWHEHSKALAELRR